MNFKICDTLIDGHFDRDKYGEPIEILLYRTAEGKYYEITVDSEGKEIKTDLTLEEIALLEKGK